MAEELIDRLRAIADHRPPYGKPKEGESVDQALYSVLYRFLARYPNGYIFTQGELKTIRGVSGFFGQLGNTDSQRLHSLEQAIIAAAPMDDRWTVLFEHGRGIGERLVAIGVPKKASIHSKALANSPTLLAFH